MFLHGEGSLIHEYIIILISRISLLLSSLITWGDILEGGGGGFL